MGHLFLAGATTMTDRERPLLAVDLDPESGRTLRLPQRGYAEVSANACIANPDFDDVADAADAAGVYRGYDGQ